MDGSTSLSTEGTPSPATPAPPAPAPSSSLSADTPASFAEALTARMAVPAPADPATPPPVGDPPPAALVQAPAVVAADPAVPEPKGPIPYDRHESILKNARTKTETETAQRFQQQYGAHVELGNRISADPVGTVVGLIETLAAHPEHGAAVISALARTLGGRRSQAVVADQEPQADLQTSDGTLVYSAPQLAKHAAWQRSQLESAFDQRLAPLQQREEQRLAHERITQAKADAHTRMAKVLEPYKQMLPDFETHKPVLWEKAQGYLAEGHDAQTALGLSVLSVLHERVVPAQTAQRQQQLVAQAVAKSTGSTSAPGTAPAAPAGRPTSFEDAFQRVTV